MEPIKIEVENILDVFDIIRRDVYAFTETGIYKGRLRVSIPRIIMEFLIHTVETSYENPPLFLGGFCNRDIKQIFGISIVAGYNNQICVFDEMAAQNGYFARPIEIVFKHSAVEIHTKSETL